MNLSNTDKSLIIAKEYAITKASKSLYAAQLNEQITVRFDEVSIGYIKGISEQV